MSSSEWPESAAVKCGRAQGAGVHPGPRPGVHRIPVLVDALVFATASTTASMTASALAYGRIPE